eukprot:CAMPEP_0183423454 /NCGR_PEP_ID=MMETSP0370-20130417/28491_1 /TAXON_ID=268820 /ORGANISM="Peridinium aciculiferum, Strain PAER-2" /LENGTH=61 /DNA_ID=CAMNT_0025607639 /DNA_START=210 /DNA_END=395 /DNA_ORIENTATION=+
MHTRTCARICASVGHYTRRTSRHPMLATGCLASLAAAVGHLARQRPAEIEPPGISYLQRDV